jgi:serine/threonine protein kinase
MGHATSCPVDGAPLGEMVDPLIGRTIGGRYRIESKIGAGGMATVYRASIDVLGRKVAVKFLAPEFASDPTQRQRFLREARATNRIRHEHIVDITDFGDEGKLVYLVMELLEGEPLNHRIARGPMAPPEAIELLLQVTRALAHAHELEVIHRDLKPENIFLTQRDGRVHVKLLDFGLAHVSDEMRLTVAGSVFGTPEYLSPEQARGAANVGPASDLYALGVVFFEMLTTRLPFEGSVSELILRHQRAKPPAPSEYIEAIPPEIDAIVLKLLSKSPGDRHRDAHHLYEELQGALESFLRSNASPPPVPAPVAHREGSAAEESDTPTNPDGALDHRTVVMSNATQWIDRRSVYREALELAYPRRDAPPWLLRRFEKLDGLVSEFAQTESELERLGRGLAEREADASDARERIGRALDELWRDESGLKRQIEELDRRVDRASSLSEQVVTDFRAAWSEAVLAVGPGGALTPESADAVERVGRKALAWRQAQDELAECRTLSKTRVAANEDLRFQVSQLKGRLGALNAEVEREIDGLRTRASELGALNAGRLEELNEIAAAIGGHLSDFASARALLGSVAMVQRSK